MNTPNLSDLIPHTKAMFLLHRLLSVDEEKAVCEARVTSSSLFFHNGSVGAWVALEYMAQTVAAHACYLDYLVGVKPRMGLLLGSRRFKSQRARFHEGCILTIKAQRIYAADNGMGSYECAVFENEESISEATLTAFQPQDQKLLLEGYLS